MTSSGLCILSPELLAIVFGFLTGESSTLAQVCLVTHTFNKLATPVLYKCFRDRRYFTSDEENPRLFAFLRTVIARPDLARLVKEVATKSMTDGYYGQLMIKDDLKASFFRQIDNLSCILFDESLAGGARMRWKKFIEDGDSLSIWALLLCSLPDIETLFFKTSNEPFLFFNLLGSAASRLKTAQTTNITASIFCYSELHSVRTVSSNLQYGYLDFQWFHTFFNLPKIRNFETALANGEWTDDDESERWDVVPRSSSIEKLSFQYSAMTGSCITAIINSCAHLQEFHFTYGRNLKTGDHRARRWSFRNRQDFTPMQLLQALLGHADSLEVLHVDYDDDWEKVSWSYLDLDDIHFSTELSSLSKLRKLHVTFSALFGFGVELSEGFMAPIDDQELPEDSFSNMLPESLEELIILSCDHRVLPPLQNLAQACERGQFQKLRRIHCSFAEEYTEASNIVKIEIPTIDIDYLFQNFNTRQSRLQWQDCSEIYDADMLLDQ